MDDTQPPAPTTDESAPITASSAPVDTTPANPPNAVVPVTSEPSVPPSEAASAQPAAPEPTPTSEPTGLAPETRANGGPLDPPPQLQPSSEPEPAAAPAPVPEQQAPTEAQPQTANATDSGYPRAVLALSDDELRLASKLYATRHQKELSQKGVQFRQQRMNKRLNAILEYMKSHDAVQIPHLSNQLNMSPRLVSHYLGKLRKQGKVTAEGWGSIRTFKLA